MKKHGRLVRLAALFFLLYTGADLFLPQYFCTGEMGGVPTSTRVLASNGTNINGPVRDVSSRSQNTEGEHSPEKEVPHEEDCFCCCAHVLPSLGFAAVKASDLKTQSNTPGTDSLPSPPLRGTYHPPRIA